MIINRLAIFFLSMGLWCSTQSQVVINEVFAGPPPHPNDNSPSNTANANSMYSTDNNMQPSYNREYVELYNSHPCDTVDISCYTLGSNANSSSTGQNWGAFTFPQGSRIPPLGFLIVGGNYAPVPINDFNITNYRQTSFNTQYLTGDFVRWFLRDQWGWIALYNSAGQPVDAVYWNASPGSAANLYSTQEYQNTIVNTLACGGTKTHAAAANIPGITYVGNIQPGTMTSFQRVQDGSPTWHPGPVAITPRAPNGVPIAPPTLNFNIVPEHCGMHDGVITVIIISGGTGPYTVYWNSSSTSGGNTISNLVAGTYTVEVRDAFDCLKTFDTIVVPDDAGPLIDIFSVVDEKCSAKDGSVMTNITGGLQPYTILWNTTPPITNGNLLSMSAGTYRITVTDAAGCISTDSVTIKNHKEPILNIVLISPDSCGYGIGKALAEVTGDYHPYQYLWNSSPQQTDSIAVKLPAGNYAVTVTDGVCTVTGQIVIPLIPGPVADFVPNPDKVYVQDGVVAFTDLSAGQISSWLWDFTDGSISALQHPVHKFTSLGTYNVKLTVTDNIGCEGSASHPVLVKDITTAYFPNAFSPDGDGNNDVFMPKGIYITNYHLSIYDRWGRLIFFSESPEEGWDGKSDGRMMPEGVYIWQAFFTHDYGENIQKDLVLKGTVTLIR